MASIISRFRVSPAFFSLNAKSLHILSKYTVKSTKASSDGIVEILEKIIFVASTTSCGEVNFLRSISIEP